MEIPRLNLITKNYNFKNVTIGFALLDIHDELAKDFLKELESAEKPFDELCKEYYVKAYKIENHDFPIEDIDNWYEKQPHIIRFYSMVISKVQEYKHKKLI